MELLQETLGSRLRRSLAQAWAFVRSAVSAPEAQAQGLALDAGRALDEWGTSILRLALSYLHSREDAEDILQDTLIRYLTAKPVLQSREHEKAWLLRVAANLCKNRIDYNRVRQADELKEELLGEEREDLAFVWEAVAQLPEAQRAAIHLFYHEGYQTAEIARILGRREATVRSDLKRGRERLKAILKEAYDFDPIQ
ncbi:MAG: sigma-70 family RNA polymerase sigma factor [Oscillospiraceae bacterium]|nr:sigma-70 family RNA polymerase sigma factor [Oscillospiraceae bacterium]